MTERDLSRKKLEANPSSSPDYEEDLGEKTKADFWRYRTQRIKYSTGIKNHSQCVTTSGFFITIEKMAQ